MGGWPEDLARRGGAAAVAVGLLAAAVKPARPDRVAPAAGGDAPGHGGWVTLTTCVGSLVLAGNELWNAAFWTAAVLAPASSASWRSSGIVRRHPRAVR